MKKAGYTTAQVEILGKYDAEGHLQEIGVSFRGTSGPRENLIGDSIGDVINDLMAALGPKDYAKKTTSAKPLATCWGTSRSLPRPMA
nr:hypothetical protein GCM10020185_76860 [Pseudomonas brassicacearum subsp. brassicacearum]